MTTEYTAPTGLRTRGTVLIVPGRGESPATYQRSGRRAGRRTVLVAGCGNRGPLADRDAIDRIAKRPPHRGARSPPRRANDLQHRSVAAEIVLFLEVLRGTPALAPIVTVQSSGW